MTNRHFVGRLGGLLVAALLSPTPSSGQSGPPDQAVPAPGQAAPSPPSGQAAPSWALSLRLDSSWDDNVLLTGAHSRSFVSRLTANLNRSWRWRRGNADVGTWGSGVRFWEHKDLNRVNYGAAARESFNLGPRSTLNLSHGFSSSYTRETDFLLQGGLLLPRAVVRRIDSAVDFTKSLSARTALSVDAGYELLLFDSNQLIDGSAVTGGLSLTRQIGRRGSLTFGSGVYGSFTQGRNFSTYWASVGGSRQISRRATLDGSVGVMHFPVRGSSDRLAVRGDAGLKFSDLERRGGNDRLAVRGDAGPTFSGLELRYHRSFGQAFGLGRDRIATLAWVRYGRPLGRRFGVWTYYGFARNEDPADSSQNFDTHHALGGLSCRIWRRWAVGTGYGLDRLSQTAPAQPVTGQRWIVRVFFGEMLTWRW